MKFSAFTPDIKAAPLLGEHTAAVLQELGYSDDEIAAVSYTHLDVYKRQIIHSVAVTPEDNERFESRDVYEITLQDAIKNAAGIIKEIEEMIASEQQ